MLRWALQTQGKPEGAQDGGTCSVREVPYPVTSVSINNVTFQGATCNRWCKSHSHAVQGIRRV
jgi:hypothetical protein